MGANISLIMNGITAYFVYKGTGNFEFAIASLFGIASIITMILHVGTRK